MDRRRRGQTGATLVEVVIAVAIVSMMVVSSGAALQVLTGSSSASNERARLDAIVTGVGNSLSQLPYVECETPAGYQASFGAYDQAQPAGNRVLEPNGTSTPTMEVLKVDSGTTCNQVAGDAGRQIIDYKVTRNGRVRTAQIVKINPDKRLQLPHAVIDTPTLLTASGDTLAAYSFTGKGSYGGEGLVSYTWICDTANGVTTDFGSPAGVVATPDDSSVRCVYPADTAGTKNYTVRLTVTDTLGNTDQAEKIITVAQAVSSRLPPVAQAQGTPATGTAPLGVNFTSTGSYSPDGTIQTYKWDFGDPNSGSANSATGATASHTYQQAGTYQATLTVVDDVNAQATDSVSVSVNVVGVPAPQARFTFTSPNVAPATVAFNGTSSTAAPGQSIASYTWDFGDSSSGSGSTPSHVYANPGTYVVKLTVSDGAGRQGFYTQTVVVAALTQPTNFRVVRTRSMIPCLFFGCPGARTGYIDFAWTNANPMGGAGDTIQYQIEVDFQFGCFLWGTQYRTFSPALTPGGGGSYRWETPGYDLFSGSDNLCAGSTYVARLRVIRKTPQSQTFYTAWTQQQSVTV